MAGRNSTPIMPLLQPGEDLRWSGEWSPLYKEVSQCRGTESIPSTRNSIEISDVTWSGRSPMINSTMRRSTSAKSQRNILWRRGERNDELYMQANNSKGRNLEKIMGWGDWLYEWATPKRKGGPSCPESANSAKSPTAKTSATTKFHQPKRKKRELGCYYKSSHSSTTPINPPARIRVTPYQLAALRFCLGLFFFSLDWG